MLSICDDCKWEWCESCEQYDILISCEDCAEKNSKSTGE